MAVSKNNRKKGKKRQEVRRRPVTEAQLRAQEKIAQQEAKDAGHERTVSFLAILLMFAGFVVAMLGYRIIGYPITFIGALVSVFMTPKDLKHRKLTIGLCIVYMVMVAVLWLSEMGSLFTAG